jgi:hypothetical protein
MRPAPWRRRSRRPDAVALHLRTGAMPHLHASLRALVEPSLDLLIAHRVELVHDLVFALLDDPAEQLRDVHQRRTLVGSVGRR